MASDRERNGCAVPDAAPELAVRRPAERGGKRSRATAGLAAGNAGDAAFPAGDPIPPPQQSPLDYMLAVMRDPAADAARRDGMAKAAAPYCLSKAAAPDPADKDSGRGRRKSGNHMAVDPQDVSDPELARRVAFLLTKPREATESSQ
jgi:hypothetical protein